MIKQTLDIQTGKTGRPFKVVCTGTEPYDHTIVKYLDNGEYKGLGIKNGRKFEIKPDECRNLSNHTHLPNLKKVVKKR